MNDVEKFDEIVHELCELHKRKNESYGGAFNEVLSDMGKYGIYHATGQMYAKVKRLLSMVKNGNVDTFGESIEDSIVDLVSYGIMTLVDLKDKKSAN